MQEKHQIFGVPMFLGHNGVGGDSFGMENGERGQKTSKMISQPTEAGNSKKVGRRDTAEPDQFAIGEKQNAVIGKKRIKRL